MVQEAREGSRKGQGKASVLVAHPWLARGGSEAVAAWCLEALQSEYDVTLVTASDVDFDAVNATFATRVDAGLVRVLKAPRLPGATTPDRLVALQHAYFGRYVAQVAERFQAVVGAYNFLPNPVPTLHLVADFSWDDEALDVLNRSAAERLIGRDTLARRAYLALASWMRRTGQERVKRCDLVAANSQWTSGLLLEGYGIESDAVLSPPVPLVADGPVPGVPRDPGQFVCLGRVSPEKRIEEVIAVLCELRAAGEDVRLVIAGAVQNDGYGEQVKALAKTHEGWVTMAGFLDYDQKRELLSRSTYALHACEGEAFGIAVGEYIACGCLPLVPVSGATRELVDDPRLWYSNRPEATRKLLDLLRSPELRRDSLAKLESARMTLLPAFFCDKLRGMVAELVRAGQRRDGGTRRDRMLEARDRWAAEGSSEGGPSPAPTQRACGG